ncbi:MAG: cytochrome c [Acidimicrobiia bacterium]|nr:cytochrome c [Acidimicrobiia bacterium]
MRLTITALALAGLFCLPASAATGKELYDKSCKACHGAQGEGNPGMAKMLKVEIRHLGSPEVQKSTDAQLKKAILEGTGKMKPVKLSAADADAVVAFVRTLKK